MSVQDIIFYLAMLAFVIGPAVAGAIKSTNEKRGRLHDREANQPNDGLTVQERVDQRARERREALQRQREARRQQSSSGEAGLNRPTPEMRAQVEQRARAAQTEAQRTPGNVRSSEAEARARAQEAYRRRAEALRQRAAAKQQAQRARAQAAQQSSQPTTRMRPVPTPAPAQRSQPSAQAAGSRQQARAQQAALAQQRARQSELSRLAEERRRHEAAAEAARLASLKGAELDLRQLLREPTRLRDLVVIKEILDSPLALRDHPLY
ncbi:hypothetical protein [Mucisphaera sp.]|uniref:hypothetical protein n=1 Tax=Mucisphaera sp. TaxID=2913024 RepID=UPI003D1247D8